MAKKYKLKPNPKLTALDVLELLCWTISQSETVYDKKTKTFNITCDERMIAKLSDSLQCQFEEEDEEMV